MAAFLMTAAWQANAVVVFSSTTSIGNQSFLSPVGFVLGMDFTVNTPGTVTAIGAFYDTSSGTGFGSQTIPVAIYNVGTGLMVPGTEVDFTGSPIAGDLINNNFWYRSITPVPLASGTYSIVAANYANSSIPGTKLDYNSIVSGDSTVLSFDDAGGALTVGNARSQGGSTLLLPDSPYLGPAPPPQLGAGSFDFTPVPEATAFGGAAAGLLGLVYGGRYLALRRRMKLA